MDDAADAEIKQNYKEYLGLLNLSKNVMSCVAHAYILFRIFIIILTS
jgi:hypothetical protein